MGTCLEALIRVTHQDLYFKYVDKSSLSPPPGTCYVEGTLLNVDNKVYEEADAAIVRAIMRQNNKCNDNHLACIKCFNIYKIL